MDGLSWSARLRNYSADFAVPDSGAAASAIATGTKVRNGTLSIDEASEALRTILEIAHERRPRHRYCHRRGINEPVRCRILCTFRRTQNRTRKRSPRGSSINDQSMLRSAAARRTFKKARQNWTRGTFASRAIYPSWNDEWLAARRVLGLFAENDLAFADDMARRAEQPSLADMVRRAIQLLELSRHGYILIVDAHLMASAAWQNLGERTLRQTTELDRA